MSSQARLGNISKESHVLGYCRNDTLDSLICNSYLEQFKGRLVLRSAYNKGRLKIEFFLLIGNFGRLTFRVTVPRQRIPEP